MNCLLRRSLHEMSQLIFWENKTILKCCLLKFLSSMVSINPSLGEHDMPCLSKQCRSRSVGFWRSRLIWIYTVCHIICEFLSKTQIKYSGWLEIRSGRGILIYSAWQGLNGLTERSMYSSQLQLNRNSSSVSKYNCNKQKSNCKLRY